MARLARLIEQEELLTVRSGHLHSHHDFQILVTLPHGDLDLAPAVAIGVA